MKKVILKDVAVFTDPFDVYQKKLIARLSKEEKDRLGAGEKAKKLADKDKDRTTLVDFLLFLYIHFDNADILN